MTVDMCDQKIWDVRASNFAKNTHNPIRAIVESLQLEPNPNKQMISLSIGNPTIFGNLTPPKKIIDSVKKTVDWGKCNGYPPSTGTTAARQAVADYSSSDKVTVDWKDVILCSGCSTALDLCISVIANPGENILIPRPGFSLYRTLAEGLGIKVKPYNLRPDYQWEVDLRHLESQIDNKTRAIIINNPSNPCGSVFSKRHLREILKVASRHCLPIIADEIYEHLVFSGEEFFPLASLSTDVPILSCSGLTKRFLIPGWRVGWIVIHDRNGVFEKEIKPGLTKLSQRTLGCNTIVQGAITEILKYTPPDFFNNTIKTLQKNATIAYKKLSEIPGLKPIMPQGAMYIMIGIDMAFFPDIQNDLEFVELMVTEESVFCLPGKCFDYPNFVRIIISPPEDMIREACERIAEFCERHYKPPSKSSERETSFREVTVSDSPGSEILGRNLA
ncbi:tyrosine aminotransferase, putative [Pediculus humanus corporis]|uniref:Tyrosine aminotransferase n=1 Tax=Pediculus humanus subsp. corporis TaxID=121224 RepID=E0VY60_PEDHC|nr:tyrosine aminotransferase, putative [Pediculus humanus corporis]EEB18316.1 tyrosine aminotransferase, putative [Pediculus humanus corporis]